MLPSLGRPNRHMCFFFSSRRRHTRSYGDWSSDVCSSDLGPGLAEHIGIRHWLVTTFSRPSPEIGRASCRERGWIWGVAGACKKKEGVRDAEREILLTGSTRRRNSAWLHSC